MISGFHAHVYFEPESRSSAENLHTLLGHQFGARLRHCGKLIDRPIGPHPLPMFEIDFVPAEFAEVVGFLMLNHGELSILIHPETGEDLKDHTAHALWLGKQLPLNLEIF
ncbi:MAG: DOPA 4,5-dioxygenase family protein [Bdellovibrionota bacterium]